MMQCGLKDISARRGFTLLEMAVVLIVLSLMTGGLLAVATQNIRLAKQKEIKTKLDAIETALLSFRKGNNRLPCPAVITLADTNASFGSAAATNGTCTGTLSSGNTVAGMVPVRALALPDNYAYDPWGGRFLYAVDVRATGTDAFTTYTVTSTTLGDIEVRAVDDTVYPGNPIALLLSFGQNGHGAYQSNAVQKFVGSANAHEQENCDCDEDSYTGFNEIFYMHPATTSTSGALDSFDDIVRYYTRSQFTSSTVDTLTEKP